MVIHVSAGSTKVRPHPDPGIGINPLERPPSASTLYQELAPLRVLMSLVMLWPIRTKSRGEVEALPLFSGASCFLVATYACLSVMNASTSLSHLEAMGQDALSTGQRMHSLILVLLLATHWLVPFVYWAQSRRLARYFNSWTSFQDEWRAVTGRPLRLTLRRRAQTLVAASLALPGLAVVAFGLPLEQTPVFLPIAVQTFLTGAVWTTLCEALADVANDMKWHFRKRPLGEIRVREFGSLWLQLQALTDQTASTLSICMLHYTISSMVVCVVTSVAVMIALTHHDFDAQVVGQVLLVLENFRHLYVVHNSGHLAVSGVEFSLKTELLSLKCDPGERIYWEVRMFLRAIEANPAALQLSGFTGCSRSGMITVFNVLCVNLLVLSQLATV